MRYIVWRNFAVLITMVMPPLEHAGAKIVVVASGGACSLNRCEDEVAANKAYGAATRYLQRAPLAARVIDRLTSSKTVYTIEVASPLKAGREVRSGEFDASRNTIYWDPKAGLEWKPTVFSRASHSAAVALMHELGHAYHKDLDPVEFRRQSQARTRDGWGNLEERRTILNVENPVARTLGESERRFHECARVLAASSFETAHPTSRRKAQVSRPLFERLF